MLGLAFHWEPPYKDIYSGMDPYGNAWKDLADTFGLELAVISPAFPPPSAVANVYDSLDSFLLNAVRPGDKVAYAYYSHEGASPALSDIDWLVVGPVNWSPPENSVYWKYPISPGGGWHPLHLAHLACASM